MLGDSSPNYRKGRFVSTAPWAARNIVAQPDNRTAVEAADSTAAQLTADSTVAQLVADRPAADADSAHRFVYPVSGGESFQQLGDCSLISEE